MHPKSIKSHLITFSILLGIIDSVYLIRPSVLLKRSLLKRHLVPINGTLRHKRQLFRDDIPHHRPLSGNTYYLHAGFPHPSRWHDGPQTIQPNHEIITHHHLQHQHGRPNFLHDDGDFQHHHDHDEFNHQHQHQNNELLSPSPVPLPILDKNPHSVTIQSAIVHSGIGDNSIVNHALGLGNQANFDHLLLHTPPPPLGNQHRHTQRKPKPPKPHSEPDDEYDSSFNDSDGHNLESTPLKQPTRKPKKNLIITYHPVSVGTIINLSDDHKVTTNSYGPPKHIPGVPLDHKDVLNAMAAPFFKTPFKTHSGSPDFIDFKHSHPHSSHYGPPHHQPGSPLDSLHLEPMVPSYGPPLKNEHVTYHGHGHGHDDLPPKPEELSPFPMDIPGSHEHLHPFPMDLPGKPEPIPPYGVALPLLAHFHSGHFSHAPHPRPPKRHRGKGSRHQVHFHHFHPGHHPSSHSAESPFYEGKYPPVHVVHGHVPNKFGYHSAPYRSRPHKSFWSL